MVLERPAELERGIEALLDARESPLVDEPEGAVDEHDEHQRAGDDDRRHAQLFLERKRAEARPQS